MALAPAQVQVAVRVRFQKVMFLWVPLGLVAKHVLCHDLPLCLLEGRVLLWNVRCYLLATYSQD